MSSIVDWAAGRARWSSFSVDLWWAAMPIRPCQRGRADIEIPPFSYRFQFPGILRRISENLASNRMETELSDLTA